MDYEARAESIIKTEGFIFALAIAGKADDSLVEARGYLKAAIVRALIDAAIEGVPKATTGE